MAENVNMCQVCMKITSKYKCPKCRLKYCSVGCYKVHRQNECHAPPAKPSVIFEIDAQGSVSSHKVLFPTDDTVMPEALEKLCSSGKLRTLLKNPHLRDMLKEVDSARNAEVVIRRAMMEPIFTEFADICLSIAEPDEEDADIESYDI